MNQRHTNLHLDVKQNKSKTPDLTGSRLNIQSVYIEPLRDELVYSKQLFNWHSLIENKMGDLTSS